MIIRYYIYSITCAINNKVYIGVTKNILKRKYDHFFELKKNNHRNRFLQDDFNKYGIENFHFDFISEYESKYESLRVEKYYTDVIFGLSQDVCYNIVGGGAGGYFKMPIKTNKKPITEETREKLKLRSANQKQSLETRNKRIDTLRGANCYRAKKVIDTNTGKIFYCLKDVMKETSINYNTLRTWLNGVRPNKSSYEWCN